MRSATRLPIPAALVTVLLLLFGCSPNENNEAGYALTGRGPSAVDSDTLASAGSDTSWSVDLPLAASSRLFTGAFSGYEAVTLVAFTDLPAGATVTGATFILDPIGASVDDSLALCTLQLAPVSSNWDSTWTGADLGTLNLDSAAAERTVLIEAALDTVHFSLPPALVQSWIDDPVAAGRGLAIAALSPAPFLLAYYSVDASGTAASRRPRISLTYIPAGGTSVMTRTHYTTADLVLLRFTPGPGPAGSLRVGRGAPFRTLLTFDIGAVPSGVTVNRAELNLWFDSERVLDSPITIAAALPLDFNPWSIHSGMVLLEGSLSYAASISTADTTATLNVTPTLEVAVLAGEPVLQMVLLASNESSGVGYLQLRTGVPAAQRARLRIVYSIPPGESR